MGTRKAAENKEKKWPSPGESLNIEEFKKGIEAAEKSHFYSVSEAKSLMSQWKKSKKEQ